MRGRMNRWSTIHTTTAARTHKKSLMPELYTGYRGTA